MTSLAFYKLAEVYENLENISSYNAMRDLFARFFKIVPKEDIEKVCYLTLGRIGPEFKDIELGMAGKMILKAIAKAFNADEKEVLADAKKRGDIGLVAEDFGKGKPSLKVKEVFDTLWKIHDATGSGSQDKKMELLGNLLHKATPKEAKFIARIALGTLRLGSGAATMLDALAIAYTGNKANREILESAYNSTSDVGLVAKTLVFKGLKAVEKLSGAIGTPIKMMLAQRVGELTEIKERMHAYAAEEKYDGERMQVHKRGNEVIIFSRRLDNISSQFPDVIAAIKTQIKAKECRIEGECTPVINGKIQPFQLLMQRRRKYGVEEYVKKIPVTLFLFDLLYLNGKNYINEDYPKRRSALENIVRQSRVIQLAKRNVAKSPADLEKFFTEAIKEGTEGIMVKSCDKGSVYQAGTRGWLWVKWKREYSKKTRDTFDLVVVGALAGRGQRGGTYGALLCAVYNESKDRYETFTKVGAGFKDKELKELPRKLSKYKVSKAPSNVLTHKMLQPDVFFTPKIVVEVRGAEITKSPIHMAARDRFKDVGLALRFPIFLRYREDKGPKDATTVKEIMQMYGKK
jgi:DNA ligase-1